MIFVGLAGWGDHNAIYPPGIKPRDKLKAYSLKFPIVEVDSSFYARSAIRLGQKKLLPSFSLLSKRIRE
jgi:uncharacterized protein YecE (DUF72 family)